MAHEKSRIKESAVIVFTGDGKGKTSAGLGLVARALGGGYKVAFIQFIKEWNVSEHDFIANILPIYSQQLTFYKGGLGFFEAGELSSDATKKEHIEHAKKTYDFAYKSATSGNYQLVVCDEINNAVHDGLLSISDIDKLISDRNPKTSLCLTGRHFPYSLSNKVDILTDMTKVKHHYDYGYVAIKGIDY